MNWKKEIKKEEIESKQNESIRESRKSVCKKERTIVCTRTIQTAKRLAVKVKQPKVPVQRWGGRI